MKTVSVVTTFNDQGLKKYGQRMIESYGMMWPSEVKLYAYAEDCKPKSNYANVEIIDLHNNVPKLVAFKEKWKNVPKANGDVSQDPIRSKRRDAGKGFKWDAVRFSHKVYSIFHCAQNCNTDWLMWMDADMLCHSPISLKEIDNLLPDNADLCYIGRERKWPECGLYGVNLKSKMGLKFLEEFEKVYENAEQGIFQMEEWHDSFVFEEVRKTMKLTELNWSKGLIRGEGHPLINSVWGAYLDHLKGARKNNGKSLRTDLIKPRTESYWRSI